MDELDPALRAALPANSEILSIAQHGGTNWSTGLRIDVLDGSVERSFFAKIIEREELVGMSEAEYEGLKAMAAVIPNNTVRPVAWGYFRDTNSKAWSLAEYYNLRARAPPLNQLVEVIHQMHANSVSPTGKFGFHVTPYFGPPPMQVGWTDSWEEFFIREFRADLNYLAVMRGGDDGFLDVAEEFIEKVIKRLLRPLQTGGRSIKPSLCHGALWDGNIQFNVDSLGPIIYDPCPFYGHHEMDFQCMKSPRYSIGEDFIKLYKDRFLASEPSEDFEDRISLYAIRNDIMVAGMWPQWSSLVDKAKSDMQHLIQKHPGGLAGFKGSLEPTRPNLPSKDGHSRQIPHSGENTVICTSISSMSRTPLKFIPDTQSLVPAADGICSPPKTAVEHPQLRSGTNLARSRLVASISYRTGFRIVMRRQRLKRTVKLPLKSNGLKSSVTQLSS